MKITNIRYGIITDEKGEVLTEYQYKVYNKKAIAIYLGIILFVAIHLVAWYG